MKVALTIAERIALFGVLPPEGDIVTLRLIRELRNNLSFTEKELKDWGIKMEKADGGMTIMWDSDYNNVTETFEIGETAKSLIVGQLEKLAEQKKLRMETLSLYEKLVRSKEGQD